jgi:hypothetical protein
MQKDTEQKSFIALRTGDKIVSVTYCNIKGIPTIRFVFSRKGQKNLMYQDVGLAASCGDLYSIVQVHPLPGFNPFTFVGSVITDLNFVFGERLLLSITCDNAHRLIVDMQGCFS